MQKILAILAVSVLLSAPASAAVVLGGPVYLSSGTPFTFGPSAADQFSLSYPTSGLFADTFVSTTGTAEVSSFGGFLGIPVEPSTFFTDMRGGSDVLFGPDQFGSYAGFATATDIPYSSSDSFLGLRYMVGDNTFYGFAQFAGGDLERYGFETTPNTDIDANFPVAQVPEASTWAMMMLGFAGIVLVAGRRSRSLRLA
ncbi:MAG TPA: PEP-CTERM sorting domain-containing protein [Roseiarcus sp.]